MAKAKKVKDPLGDLGFAWYIAPPPGDPPKEAGNYDLAAMIAHQKAENKRLNEEKEENLRRYQADLKRAMEDAEGEPKVVPMPDGNVRVGGLHIPKQPRGYGGVYYGNYGRQGHQNYEGIRRPAAVFKQNQNMEEIAGKVKVVRPKNNKQNLAKMKKPAAFRYYIAPFDVITDVRSNDLLDILDGEADSLRVTIRGHSSRISARHLLCLHDKNFKPIDRVFIEWDEIAEDRTAEEFIEELVLQQDIAKYRKKKMSSNHETNKDRSMCSLTTAANGKQKKA